MSSGKEPFFDNRELHAWAMLVFLIITLAVVNLISGCSPPGPPAPLVTPIALAPPYETAETLYAYHAYRTLAHRPSPDITPTPDGNKPQVGDPCPTCNGQGKVDGDKDGKIDFDCSDCQGDGRIDSGDPILTALVGGTTRPDLASLSAMKADLGELATQVSSQFDRIEIGLNDLFDRTAKLSQTVEKLQRPPSAPAISSQEKTQPKSQSSSGYWTTKRIKECLGNGRCIYRNIRIWIPSAALSDPYYYPLRNPNQPRWTGCNSWVHLTTGIHNGVFDYEWLSKLDAQEVQSLHADAHEGRINWQYAKPY